MKQVFNYIGKYISDKACKKERLLAAEYQERAIQDQHRLASERNMWADRWASIFDAIQIDTKPTLKVYKKIQDFFNTSEDILYEMPIHRITDDHIIWHIRALTSSIERAEIMRIIWNKLAIKIPYNPIETWCIPCGVSLTKEGNCPSCLADPIKDELE